MGIALLTLASGLMLGAAPAPGDRTTPREVVPAMTTSGLFVGCQVSFEVARDPAGPDGITDITAALLSMRTKDGSAVGGLKLWATKGGGKLIPDATSFVDGDALSDAEQFSTRTDDGGPARVTAFSGPITRKVLDAFKATGKFRIAVRMPGQQASIWAVDFTGNQALRDRWSECLAKAAATAPAI